MGQPAFKNLGLTLVTVQYFFDKFYQNFQFIELVLKIAEEPQIRVIFVSSDNVINLYGAKLICIFD